MTHKTENNYTHYEENA